METPVVAAAAGKEKQGSPKEMGEEEKALRAKIVAATDVLQGLQDSKGGVKGAVKELQGLKEEYAKLTGRDYKGDSAIAAASQRQKEEQAKPAGPSKNELKKQAKLKAKEASKAASKASKGKEGQGSAAGAPKGAANVSLEDEQQQGPPLAFFSPRGLPVLHCEAGSADVLKCLAAAELFGVSELHMAEQSPARVLAAAAAGGGAAGGAGGADGRKAGTSTSLATEGGGVVLGANAVCAYLARKSGGSGASSAKEGLESDLLLEWDERVLSPCLRAGQTDKCLSALEGRLQSGQAVSEGAKGSFFSGGKTLSLADVVLGGTALAATEAVSEGGGGGYPGVEDYALRLKGTPTFQAVHAKRRKVEAEFKGSSGLTQQVVDVFSAAIQRAFSGIASVPAGPTKGKLATAIVTRSNYAFADYQCNSAMQIHALLKSGALPGVAPSLSPKATAERLLQHLPASALFSHLSVTPQGYINMRLRRSLLAARVAHMARFGPQPPQGPTLRVTVDFSSPNIAKEMHVGHLRSTILGDAICRILEFCGHSVLRVNHVGDWGTQFGMLINHLKVAYPDFMTSPPDITDLTVFYKGAKKAFDDSEEFKQVSRETVVKLQSGDEHCLQVWQLLCDISRQAFEKVYKRLDVKLTEKGESFYNARIPPVLKELEEAGLTQEDKGATIIMLDAFTFPLIVRKGDGGFGYDSTDMAALSYRLREEECEWVVYVTDEGQAEHFDMCFQAAKAAGWVKADKHRLVHVPFGVVKGEDGQKFKSRSGETVRLVDLLDEAVRRMNATLQERIQEGKSPLSVEEASAAAETIGYGAVKYFDMRQSPRTPYVFSYDRMLDTKGNTAVYLLFAYARVASILRKAEAEKGANLADLTNGAGPEDVSIAHPSERALAFEIMQFPDILEAFLATLGPNVICEYLYALSTAFTDFVTNCHVLGSSDEMNGRLLLCQATKRAMGTCFELLGIKPLERI